MFNSSAVRHVIGLHCLAVLDSARARGTQQVDQSELLSIMRDCQVPDLLQDRVTAQLVSSGGLLQLPGSQYLVHAELALDKVAESCGVPGYFTSKQFAISESQASLQARIGEQLASVLKQEGVIRSTAEQSAGMFNWAMLTGFVGSVGGFAYLTFEKYVCAMA